MVNSDSDSKDPYELTTRILGCIIIFVALPGLYFNISVFHHFLSIEKTSFYILCMSKTISNSFILLVNLLYNGPCAIFYIIIGSKTLNRYLNQAIGYGIYIVGPFTQTIISVNRFLVVWIFPTNVPSYSNRATVAALFIIWLIGIYLTTLIGFSQSCHLKLILKPLDWSADDCADDSLDMFFNNFLYVVMFLGIISNFFNLIVVIKLLLSAAESRSLSSESSRRRHKTTVRLFIQSCIQDGIYVLDMANSLIMPGIVQNPIPRFMVSLGTNLVIHGTDGFVMYMFHRKRDKGKKVSMVSVSPKLTRATR